MRDEYADFLLSAFQSVEREIRKRGDRRYHQGEDLIQQLWVKLLGDFLRGGLSGG